MANNLTHTSVIERICTLFDSTGVCSAPVMPFAAEDTRALPWIWIEPSGRGERVTAGIVEDSLEGEFTLLMRSYITSSRDRLQAAETLESLLSAARAVGEYQGVRVTELSPICERESSAEQSTAVYGGSFTVRMASDSSAERAAVTVYSAGERLRISHEGVCRLAEGGLVGFDCPELETSFTENAFHNGSQVKKNRVGTRFMEISFEVRDRALFPELRAKVLRLMNPSEAVELKAELYGNRRIIRAFPQKAPEFSDLGVGRLPRVKLSFASSEPFFTEGEAKTLVLPVERPALSFPVSFMEDAGTVVSFTDGSAWNTVVNEGDVPVGFELTFEALEGDVRYPMIQLGSSTLMYSGTLYCGSKLVFDTRYGQKKVLLDGNYTYAIPRNSDFFELKPGENRLFVNSSDGPVNFEATLTYTPQFLGA